MGDVAVRVEGIGKRYRLGGPREAYSTLRDQLRRMVSLRRLLRRAARAEKRPPFWALKDVSFEVKAGECVGIIGRNGAGKSTLLKILSRITEPTEGGADIHGRVGSLLEVGTGFHPELTGRENIYLNGAILGMRRAEIVRKFDEIVGFAEVEKFVDTPVKHYSSGMYTRLAFAVAAHLEPEILVVDEVLAVGDAEFQKKCLGKMGEVARGGRTVLFVSHNMAAVQSLCRTGVLLDRGRVKQVGPAGEVVRAYLTSSKQAEGQFNPGGRRAPATNCEITAAWLEKDGERVDTLLFGDRVDVVLVVKVVERVKFAVELILRQQDGMPVAFAPSGLAQGWELDRLPGEVTVRCQLPPARLASGGYSVDLITAVSGTYPLLDHIESGLTFAVDSSAIGDRNWLFRQAVGQGCTVWDVTFSAC
jgi:lipopolysaccharide transport system ATP-binding protein